MRWTEVEPVRFCCWGNSPMVGQEKHQNPYEIELPQSIIDSFARFLVPEIQKLYASDEGRKELEAWKKNILIKVRSEVKFKNNVQRDVLFWSVHLRIIENNNDF